MSRYYSEQQHTTRLKARRTRLAEARRKEEAERLEDWGIFSLSPSNHSKSQSESYKTVIKMCFAGKNKLFRQFLKLIKAFDELS